MAEFYKKAETQASLQKLERKVKEEANMEARKLL